VRLVIVSAGNVSRNVIGRLGDRWEITLIDPAEDSLEMARQIRQVDTVRGDGSSRLVLRRAGLEGAEALIAASRDDDINMEACRYARELGVPRIISVASRYEHLPSYRELGVTVVSADNLTARHVEINLDGRRTQSAAFANGLAEAMEFRISHDSPLRGVSVRSLGLRSWLVATVLRDQRLIIPHGNTVLEEGDLVTVVGATEDYADMVETFTAGQANFPLDYGLSVAVSLSAGPTDDGVLAEAAHFVKFTAADSILALHPPLERMEPEDAEDLRCRMDQWRMRHENIEISFMPASAPGIEAPFEAASTESVGVVVFPRPPGRRKVVGLIEMSRQKGVPLLIASGRFPYSGPLVVMTGEEDEEWQGTREAIDMAAHSGTALQTVGVLPPQFLPGEKTLQDIRSRISRVREEASVHGVTIRRRILRGNPVRVVDELSTSSLVVMGIGGHPYTYLRPGIVGLMAATVDSSVILIPSRS